MPSSCQFNPRDEEPPIFPTWSSLLSAPSSAIQWSAVSSISALGSVVFEPEGNENTIIDNEEKTSTTRCKGPTCHPTSTPGSSSTGSCETQPSNSTDTATSSSVNADPTSSLPPTNFTSLPPTPTASTSSFLLPTDSSSLSSLSPPSSTQSPIPNAVGATRSKTVPIVVGVVVPVVLIGLAAAGVVLYKRRRRARDRREWERTHEAIADAVRQVGGPASSAAALPAWSRRDGEATPLFEKSGGADSSSLGPKAGGDFLSHSPASIG
ncbi:hypothetical protein C8R47DRAFT_1075951 [Mycena vitilis]|nr:hypothetical protein C8R47DRAFT_1075951 [Mycena vitilis]